MDSRQVGIRQQRSLDRARRERPSTPAVIQRGQATRHAAASGGGVNLVVLMISGTHNGGLYDVLPTTYNGSAASGLKFSAVSTTAKTCQLLGESYVEDTPMLANGMLIVGWWDSTANRYFGFDPRYGRFKG